MRERENIHNRRQSPNHHAVAVDLQSLLPILISNPRQKFKANQNPHLIWQRESEWEKERIEMRERERIHHRHHSKPPHHHRQSPNHNVVAADLQSLLSILISNPCQKFKANQNPHLIWEKERIKMRERERIHHRRHSIPPYHRYRSPIAMLQHNGGSLRRVLLGVRFHWENLFLLFFFFLVKLFLLQHNTGIYNKENLI